MAYTRTPGGHPSGAVHRGQFPESRSHPEWGIVQGLAIGENQDGVSVITMSVTNFFTRRVSAEGSEALRSGVPGASM